MAMMTLTLVSFNRFYVFVFVSISYVSVAAWKLDEVKMSSGQVLSRALFRYSGCDKVYTLDESCSDCSQVVVSFTRMSVPCYSVGEGNAKFKAEFDSDKFPVSVKNWNG
jgi:hypothetical protein